MTEQHPVDDLVALALDQLDPTEREWTLRHLAACPDCRAEFEALSAGVELTLAAAPPSDPPAGFEARVLAALAREKPSGSARRRLRSRWALAAASVAAGVAVGMGLATVLDDPHEQEVVATPDTVTLRTGDGTAVGSITPGFDDGGRVYVITVTSGKVGMHYVCRLRLADGRTLDVADWLLEAADGTWVVDAPAEQVDEVVLVADRGSGPVWSRAVLRVPPGT